MPTDLLQKLFLSLLRGLVTMITFGLSRHLSLFYNSSEVIQMDKLVLEVVSFSSGSKDPSEGYTSLGMRVWDLISLRAASAAISAKLFGLRGKGRYYVRVISGRGLFQDYFDKMGIPEDLMPLSARLAESHGMVALFRKRDTGTWEVNPIVVHLLNSTNPV